MLHVNTIFSDEYNAKLEEALAEAAAQGAVFEEPEAVSSEVYIPSVMITIMTCFLQVAFNCEKYDPSDSVPTSGKCLGSTIIQCTINYSQHAVDELRPGDIKVMAAIGDSLTVSVIIHTYIVCNTVTP